MKNWNKEKKVKYLIGFGIGSLLLLLLSVFFCFPKIQTEDMETTLMKDDRVVCSCRAYHSGKLPKRGDLIYFSSPCDKKKKCVERVVGLPNEKIVIQGNTIWINEQQLQEFYLPDSWKGNKEKKEFLVPSNHYLILGDNRDYSNDSRIWANEALEKGLATSKKEADSYTYLPQKAIIGKVLFRLSFHPELYH